MCSHADGRQCLPACPATANVANGSSYPSAVASYTWNYLLDGKTTYVGSTSGYAAITTASTSPAYIQLQLDTTYDNIIYIGVWPDDATLTATGTITQADNLTIWLSTIPNFASDPLAVTCVVGLNRLIQATEKFVSCPNATGIKYVTFQRVSTGSYQLALQEARIYTSGRL